MLLNSEKIILVPPATNQWPQTHHIDDDHHKVSMEKPGEKQQATLKCPRCDSSNTKFCYYNNYSLSQPRHFCKACKRYWTRGGTLRNVPVGGGYRKHKRVKKPSIDTTPSQPRINIASTSNHINPLFYGLLPSNSGYGLHPQLNDYRNGFTTSNNNTLLSSYSNSMFSSSTSSTPVLLSSNLLQQKFMNGSGGVKEGAGSNTFQGLAPLVQMQRESNVSEGRMVALKDVKVELEGQKKRLDEWNGVCQSQMEHVGLSDPTSLYWNTASAMAAWNDQPNNIGLSLTNSFI